MPIMKQTPIKATEVHPKDTDGVRPYPYRGITTSLHSADDSVAE